MSETGEKVTDPEIRSGSKKRQRPEPEKSTDRDDDRKCRIKMFGGMMTVYTPEECFRFAPSPTMTVKLAKINSKTWVLNFRENGELVLATDFEDADIAHAIFEGVAELMDDLYTDRAEAAFRTKWMKSK